MADKHEETNTQTLSLKNTSQTPDCFSVPSTIKIRFPVNLCAERKREIENKVDALFIDLSNEKDLMLIQSQIVVFVATNFKSSSNSS